MFSTLIPKSKKSSTATEPNHPTSVCRACSAFVHSESSQGDYKSSPLNNRYTYIFLILYLVFMKCIGFHLYKTLTFFSMGLPACSVAQSCPTPETPWMVGRRSPYNTPILLVKKTHTNEY